MSRKDVMPEARAEIIEWRRLTGADRWDEMWDGVLHMPPAPTNPHQKLAARLGRWLARYWAEPRGCEVYPPLNVAAEGEWPRNYRIPDLVLLTPDRLGIDREEYFEGAPTVAVEIRSLGDGTYEKLPFHANLGVPEVWIVDRDTKRPEIHILRDGEYSHQTPDEAGWITSPIAGVQMRTETRDEPKLAIQIRGEPHTQRVIP
jgi:Uma2 family endonuclease